MKRFNSWRLLAGLILFFAGLDVTLLLSHMSRIFGVFFLIVGGVLILTSNPEWVEKVKEKLPRRLLSLGTLNNFFKIHLALFVILLPLTIFIFLTNLYVLAFVLMALLLSELLMWRLGDHEKMKCLLLSTEFQLFVVLSTAVYFYFGELFGYRDVPDLFPMLFIIAAWALELVYIKSKISPAVKESEPSASSEQIDEPIACTFINFFTMNGLLKKYLAAAGILVLVAVISFNLWIHGSLALGSHDGITILLGISLISYKFIPDKYSTERDFAFLFLVFLFLILVLPITMIHYFRGPLQEDTTSPVVYHLLARPTAALLNLLGFSSIARVTPVRVVVGLDVPVNGRYVYREVGIGLSCTGLYSVTTFISAFLAFLMVHFSKFTTKLGVFMALGIAASWVANVFRMTLILIVRYHYGRDAMLWTHHNAGIFIFIAWIALFWGLMFKYFDIPAGR